MVHLVYLARLREAFGTRDERVELPGHVCTVAALREWLIGRGGTFARELAPGSMVRIAVNQDIADGATHIKAGDEVALFPPVTGG